jgi:hypothetical protein
MICVDEPRIEPRMMCVDKVEVTPSKLCPELPDEAADFCYLAVQRAGLAEAAGNAIEAERLKSNPGVAEFLGHIRVCVSCRRTYDQARAFIDGIRAAAARFQRERGESACRSPIQSLGSERVDES